MVARERIERGLHGQRGVVLRGRDQIVHQRLRHARTLQQHGQCLGIERADHVHVDDAVDARAFGLRQGRHVLLASVQALLFAAEQDETQIVLGRLRGQDVGDLQYAGRATAVVVGARRRRRNAAGRIHRIEVRGHEHEPAVDADARLVGDDIEAGAAADGDRTLRYRATERFQRVLAEIGSRGKLGGQGVTGAERGQSRQRIGEAGLGHHGGERGDALIRLALGARGRERLQHGCVRGQRAEPEARSTVPKHVVEFARRHIDSEITSLVDGHARAREFVQEGIAGLHDQIEIALRGLRRSAELAQFPGQ